MSRSIEERMGDVRRLLLASRGVHEDRARVAPEIARATGLSLEGVLFGFSSLETHATDADLRSLSLAAGDAERVHVILSANVFVAALRAVAIARAASAHVTVRPSPRDPAFARELLAKSGDAAISIASSRDVESIERGEIHVYGRADTVRAVRARARAGVVVRTHGPGLGVVLVSRTADPSEAAEAIATDVVPFDQRGCLSPRVVLVEGDDERGEALASALHDRLGEWGERVPRGALDATERAEATAWRETTHFIGRVHSGAGHAVGVGPLRSVASVPPPGRHVQVASIATLDDAALALAPIARHIVIVGTDDPARLTGPAGAAWSGVRVVPLGLMQRLPLDGPVDRRSVGVVARDERTSVVDGPAVGDAR